MNNIKILETGIDVSAVLKQLKQHPKDWGAQKTIEGTGDLVTDLGFPEVEAGVLQLVMGAVENEGDYVGDSEFCVPTPAIKHHTEVFKILGRYFRDVSRCAFLSLPVGGKVGTHIDIGSYYQTRDRYHLSIQGRYKYHVGDEELIIEPGMLVWFNNKLPHGTENLGDEVRITFVFDIENPEYKLDLQGQKE
jgi:mannose-6-phosphate isomerase-like protein (cupin superfamily)